MLTSKIVSQKSEIEDLIGDTVSVFIDTNVITDTEKKASVKQYDLRVKIGVEALMSAGFTRTAATEAYRDPVFKGNEIIDSVFAAFIRGRVHFLSNNLIEAERIFLKEVIPAICKNKDPECRKVTVKAAFYLAKIYWSRGNFANAVKMFDYSIRLSPLDDKSFIAVICLTYQDMIAMMSSKEYIKQYPNTATLEISAAYDKLLKIAPHNTKFKTTMIKNQREITKEILPSKDKKGNKKDLSPAALPAYYNQLKKCLESIEKNKFNFDVNKIEKILSENTVDVNILKTYVKSYISVITALHDYVAGFSASFKKNFNVPYDELYAKKMENYAKYGTILLKLAHTPFFQATGYYYIGAFNLQAKNIDKGLEYTNFALMMNCEGNKHWEDYKSVILCARGDAYSYVKKYAQAEAEYMKIKHGSPEYQAAQRSIQINRSKEWESEELQAPDTKETLHESKSYNEFEEDDQPVIKEVKTESVSKLDHVENELKSLNKTALNTIDKLIAGMKLIKELDEKCQSKDLNPSDKLLVKKQLESSLKAKRLEVEQQFALIIQKPSTIEEKTQNIMQILQNRIFIPNKLIHLAFKIRINQTAKTDKAHAIKLCDEAIAELKLDASDKIVKLQENYFLALNYEDINLAKKAMQSEMEKCNEIKSTYSKLFEEWNEKFNKINLQLQDDPALALKKVEEFVVLFNEKATEFVSLREELQKMYATYETKPFYDHIKKVHLEFKKAEQSITSIIDTINVMNQKIPVLKSLAEIKLREADANQVKINQLNELMVQLESKKVFIAETSSRINEIQSHLKSKTKKILANGNAGALEIVESREKVKNIEAKWDSLVLDDAQKAITEMFLEFKTSHFTHQQNKELEQLKEREKVMTHSINEARAIKNQYSSTVDGLQEQLLARAQLVERKLDGSIKRLHKTLETIISLPLDQYASNIRIINQQQSKVQSLWNQFAKYHYKFDANKHRQMMSLFVRAKKKTNDLIDLARTAQFEKIMDEFKNIENQCHQTDRHDKAINLEFKKIEALLAEETIDVKIISEKIEKSASLIEKETKELRSSLVQCEQDKKSIAMMDHKLFAEKQMLAIHEKEARLASLTEQRGKVVELMSAEYAVLTKKLQEKLQEAEEVQSEIKIINHSLEVIASLETKLAELKVIDDKQIVVASELVTKLSESIVELQKVSDSLNPKYLECHQIQQKVNHVIIGAVQQITQSNHLIKEATNFELLNKRDLLNDLQKVYLISKKCNALNFELKGSVSTLIGLLSEGDYKAAEKVEIKDVDCMLKSKQPYQLKQYLIEREGFVEDKKLPPGARFIKLTKKLISGRDLDITIPLPEYKGDEFITGLASGKSVFIDLQNYHTPNSRAVHFKQDFALIVDNSPEKVYFPDFNYALKEQKFLIAKYDLTSHHKYFYIVLKNRNKMVKIFGPSCLTFEGEHPKFAADEKTPLLSYQELLNGLDKHFSDAFNQETTAVQAFLEVNALVKEFGLNHPDIKPFIESMISGMIVKLHPDIKEAAEIARIRDLIIADLTERYGKLYKEAKDTPQTILMRIQLEHVVKRCGAPLALLEEDDFPLVVPKTRYSSRFYQAVPSPESTSVATGTRLSPSAVKKAG